MGFKLNDIVKVNVYRVSTTRRRFLFQVEESKEFETISCPIIGINPAHIDGPMLYMLEIPDDITGWKVSKWHIKYAGVPEKYLGTSFYELSEYFLNWDPEIEIQDSELEEIKPANSSKKIPASAKPASSAKKITLNEKIEEIPSSSKPLSSKPSPSIKPVSEKIPNTVRVV